MMDGSFTGCVLTLDVSTSFTRERDVPSQEGADSCGRIQKPVQERLNSAVLAERGEISSAFFFFLRYFLFSTKAGRTAETAF